MRFTKMHGAGNDYVYVDLFEETVDDPPAVARRVADRHTGVGSDGLILVGPSDAADVRMIMYNADGSRGRMCGNGLRCVARYAVDHGLVSRGDLAHGANRAPVANLPPEFVGLRDYVQRVRTPGDRLCPVSVETDAGVLVAAVVQSGPDPALVFADIGRPALEPEAIPTRLPGQRIVEHPLDVGAHRLAVTCVSMGSAHAVVFVDDLDATDVAGIGPVAEHHPAFPERINIHFVRVVSRRRVEVRHWERGSGMTRACGTGAAAVCVAGVLTDRTDDDIEVHAPGGVLRVCWDHRDRVYQAGPAIESFHGEWNP